MPRMDLVIMAFEAPKEVHLRPAVPGDRDVCARIGYEAFKSVAERHNFPPAWTRESPAAYLGYLIGHPDIFGVVAELRGRVVGFNFLWKFDPVRGIGPICVDPLFQGKGLGRQLMMAALNEAGRSSGVRLVQEAYNTGSLSLYASLGFEVKEFLVQVQGRPRSPMPTEVEIRPYTTADAETCAALCGRIYGFERRELRDAPDRFVPMVVTRKGGVTAYASRRSLGLGAHGVAETDDDLRALLLGLGRISSEPVSFLVPVRRATFFQWCLSEGFRVIRPLTLMAMGDYRDPGECYFPSIIY